MGLSDITINRNLVGQFLISIFIGWLIGSGISWINIFGHSEQAPFICAIAGGISSIVRLVRQQKVKLANNNSS